MRGVSGIQPDGVGVADEMDFVAAGGQFQAEFGGDDAAAAVSGIASDADVHFASVALNRTQRRVADLSVQIFVGRRHIAAAEPDPDLAASTSTVGSQITFESHACAPLNTAGSFSQCTPSVERARPRRRFSAKSRPVNSIQ